MIEHDPVNHPQHYTSHPSKVECIQITEHMSFCIGNAVKYLWRADLKEVPVEDMQKAIWYIQREIDLRGRTSVQEVHKQELSILNTLRTAGLVFVVCLLPVLAFADPPPPDSEDYKVLQPYSDWLRAQTQPGTGYGCCNISDGRLVEEKIVGDHYEVKILHPETLPTAPKGWVPVPKNALLPGGNPTGSAIAWFVGTELRCFIPASKV